MSETKQTGKYTSWILPGGFLIVMGWKCGQSYKEYRSLSNGFDTLASACSASDDQPWVILPPWDN
jgi:hypothetical protein